jgi:hypothetical protein
VFKISVSARLSPKLNRIMVRNSAIAGIGMLSLASLAGCASVASVDAAPDAANPLCAEMMVVLPEAIDDAERRSTTSQATSAWGDPSKVVLRCGVEVPGPTTDPCVSVNDVDWVAHEDEATGIWTLTTYGRTPATEVVLDPNVIPSSTVLASLSDAAQKIPASKQCVSVDKSVDL